MVDCVGFVATDCTVVVVFQELFAYGLEGGVASCFGVVCCHGGFLCVVYLAPLALPAVAFVCVCSVVVCASPHFEQAALAGGVFRTVSHSRL